MRKFVTRVFLLCASCIILLSCNSPEATKKDGNQELEIADEAKQCFMANKVNKSHGRNSVEASNVKFRRIDFVF